MYRTGVLGGTVVKSYQLTGTVMAVNASARTLSLVEKAGTKATLRCDASVANFDQLRAGDEVTAIVKDQLTMAMADSNTAPDSAIKPAERAPRAGDSRELTAATQHYTATLQAINLKRHQVTLLFPDGTTRRFEVRKDVDLAHRKLGEKVAFSVTVGTAVAVVKL
jgi:Cu/Ag efflux protein CusF